MSLYRSALYSHARTNNSVSNKIIKLNWHVTDHKIGGARIKAHVFLSEQSEAFLQVSLVFWGMGTHGEQSYTHKGKLVMQIRVKCLQVVEGWSVSWLCKSFKFGASSNGVSLGSLITSHASHILDQLQGQMACRGRPAWSEVQECNLKMTRNWRSTWVPDVIKNMCYWSIWCNKLC